MAAKAREEQEMLLRRIEALEARLAALEQARRSAGTRPQHADVKHRAVAALNLRLASAALLWQRSRARALADSL